MKFQRFAGAVALLLMSSGGALVATTKGVKGIDIMVKKHPTGNTAAQVRTDSSGAFYVTGLEPGEYTVQAVRAVPRDQIVPLLMKATVVTLDKQRRTAPRKLEFPVPAGEPTLFEQTISLSEGSDISGMVAVDDFAVEPATLSFAASEGGVAPTAKSIQALNASDQPATYQLAFAPDPASLPWTMRFPAATGVLKPGEAVELPVVPLLAATRAGAYTGRVVIITGRAGAMETRSIPVSLTVLPAASPNLPIGADRNMGVSFLVDGRNFEEQTFRITNTEATARSYDVQTPQPAAAMRVSVLPARFTLAPGASRDVVVKLDKGGEGDKGGKGGSDGNKDKDKQCATVVNDKGIKFTFCTLPGDTCSFGQMQVNDTIKLCIKPQPGSKLPVASCQASTLYPLFTQYDAAPLPGQPITGRVAVFDDCGALRTDFTGEVQLVDEVGAGIVRASAPVAGKAITKTGSTSGFSKEFRAATAAETAAAETAFTIRYGGYDLKDRRPLLLVNVTAKHLGSGAPLTGSVSMPVEIQPDLEAPQVSSGPETMFAPGERVRLVGSFPSRTRADIDGAEVTILNSTADTLDLLIPADTPIGDRTLRLDAGNGRQTLIPLLIVSAHPAVVTRDGADGALAWIGNADGADIDSGRAVRPGDVITLLATGLGAALDDVSVFIGSNQAAVRSVEPDPSSPGTYRISVQVPGRLAGGIAPGPTPLPVVVVSGGARSPGIPKGIFDANDPANIGVSFVTSPVPLDIMVAGNPVTGNSGLLHYPPSTSIALDVPAPLQYVAAERRYRFNGWSQGGAVSQTVAPAVSTAYAAYFNAEYRLTVNTFGSPAPQFTLSPASSDGFYPAGTNVTLTATCPAGYMMFGVVSDPGVTAGAGPFGGSLISFPFAFLNDTATAINLYAPREAGVGCFAIVRVTTNPASVGLAFSVDTTQYTNTYSFVGSSNTVQLSTTTPQVISGARYDFVNWTPGGSAAAQSVVANQPATYTANFRLSAYQVVVSGCNAAIGPLSAAVAPGFFPAGLPLTVNVPSGQIAQSVAVTINGVTTTYTTFPVIFPLTGPAVVAVTCAGATTSCATLSPAAQSALKGWWPLETATGTISDRTGLHNASALGSLAVLNPGRVGNALSFNPSNSTRVQIPYHSDFDVPNGPVGTGMTFDAWIQIDPASGTSGGTIFSNQRFGGNSAYSFFYHPSPGNGLSVYLGNVAGSSGGYTQIDSYQYIKDKQWHFVAVRVTKGNNSITVDFWLDGTKTSSTANGFTLLDQSTLNDPWLGTFTTGVPLYIGAAGTTGGLRPFEGGIDEVEYFNQPISDADINAIYSAGPSGKCLIPPAGSVPVTLASNPVSLPVTLTNGTQTASGNAPQSLQVSSGTLTLQAQSPVVSNGVQYTFTNFAPPGTASNPATGIPVPGSATTYTANYNITGYVVTLNPTGGCTIGSSTPPQANPWIVPPNSPIAFTVNSPAGSAVQTVTVSAGAGAAPVTLTGPTYGWIVNGPTTINLTCGPPAQQNVVVNTAPANVGLTVIADGGAVVNSQSFNWSGSHALNVLQTVQLLNGTQYTYSRWTATPPGTAIATAPATAASVTPSAATTYTAVFDVTGHLVTVNQPTGCSINVTSSQPAVNGIYPPGAVLGVTVSPSTGYTAPSQITVTPQTGAPFSLPLPVTNLQVGMPLAIGAQCQQQTNVTLTVTSNPAGLNVRIGALGNYSPGPISQQVPANQPQTISTQSSQVQNGTGYLFSGWSTGAAAATATVTPTANMTVTANFTAACYMLTVTTVGSGSVTLTPVNGNAGPGLPANCYAPGTVVTLTPVPGTGNVFSAWSGALSGSAAPATITMSAPRSVTATFAPPPQLSLSIANRTGGNLLINVTNTGGSQAVNLRLTAVSNISPSAIVFDQGVVGNPSLTLPWVWGNLGTTVTTARNLGFRATSGSINVPFSFQVTFEADNMPPTSYTVSVP